MQHGLARHMTESRDANVQMLRTVMNYIVSTENWGLLISPKEKCSTCYKFKVHGCSDLDYATNPDDQ